MLDTARPHKKAEAKIFAILKDTRKLRVRTRFKAAAKICLFEKQQSVVTAGSK
jgi:hypothetical protein